MTERPLRPIPDPTSSVVAADAAVPETMRAVCRDRFGGVEVLDLTTVPVPVCAADEVVVRVEAVALNPHDWHMLTGAPLITRLGAGLFRPKQPILGLDVAGSVVAVGASVTHVSVGDEVIALTPGGLAEFIVTKERAVVAKPAAIPFTAAAAMPVAAITALQGLRDHGRLVTGQRVLINGASGGVGTYAVQLAKVMGAEVTAVCSTRNVDLVRGLGADAVVDYTADDFTRRPERYDLVLDNVGNHGPSSIKRILEPDGTYVVIGGPKTGKVLGPMGHMLWSVIRFAFGSRRAATFIADGNRDDLAYLAGLLGDGSLTSVIDSTHPLKDTAEAMGHLASGRARGKIVVEPGAR